MEAAARLEGSSQVLHDNVYLQKILLLPHSRIYGNSRFSTVELVTVFISFTWTRNQLFFLRYFLVLLHQASFVSNKCFKHWLFPPRFPDKDRFTSGRPDFVLVTPTAAKTQTQQTNVGGAWVLRSGRGQLRETGSTSAAAPATNSTATNPRQHRPEDLNKTRRDIHLVEIKYCDDTRPQNQLNAAKVRHKDLCSISEEPPLLSTSSFWVWAAPSTTPTL